MKFKYFYLILLLGGIKNCSAETKYDMADLCDTHRSCSDINNSCPCFCSIAGGPRDKIPGQDNPKLKDGICYCAKRDFVLRDRWSDKLNEYLDNK